jgi:pimeloyl-ACP methyl ester carboxylesterase
MATQTSFPTYHRTIKIDGLSIFYREAGDARAPALVLLHGFPASSHQYRNLLPALADKFHVIAMDYPGSVTAICRTRRNIPTRSTGHPK